MGDSSSSQSNRVKAAVVTHATTPIGQAVTKRFTEAGWNVTPVVAPTDIPAASAGAIDAVIHLPADSYVQQDQLIDETLLDEQLQHDAKLLMSISDAVFDRMLAAQSGCIVGLLPESIHHPPATGAATWSLARLMSLSALSVLAAHAEKTGVRVIGVSTPSVADAYRIDHDGQAPDAWTADQLAERIYADVVDATSVSNGGVHHVGPESDRVWTMAMLADPASAVAAQAVNVVGNTSATDDLDTDTDALLIDTFRRVFALSEDADVIDCEMGNVQKWDSLGHLKLMMEVELATGVSVPADVLSSIHSYRDLRAAISRYS